MVHSAGALLAFGAIGVGASANPLDYLPSSSVDRNNFRSALRIHSNIIFPPRAPARIQEVPTIIQHRFHAIGAADDIVPATPDPLTAQSPRLAQVPVTMPNRIGQAANQTAASPTAAMLRMPA